MVSVHIPVFTTALAGEKLYFQFTFMQTRSKAKWLCSTCSTMPHAQVHAPESTAMNVAVDLRIGVRKLSWASRWGPWETPRAFLCVGCGAALPPVTHRVSRPGVHGCPECCSEVLPTWQTASFYGSTWRREKACLLSASAVREGHSAMSMCVKGTT